MRIVAAANLACPIDGLPIEAKEAQRRCAAGHSYDMAREGYCNLLVVQHKASRDPGDSKDKVAARRRFLELGHFAPIVQAANWTLPPGDGSHWLWRQSDTYVRASAAGPNLRHAHYEYDSLGNVVRTYSDLSGTLALARFHEDPNAQVAPEPADASQDGANQLISEARYDAFGNLSQVRSGKGEHCSATTYDPAFAQLPTSQTVYTHGCGGAALTNSTVYDRGFEVATMTIAPNGATSTAVYDTFGRVTQTFASAPNLPGMPETTPSTKMTYVDVQGGPYQKVELGARDGDGSAPRYRASWVWTDPFGHATATVHQADPSAGDGGPFIVSGQVQRDVRGLVTTSYQPRFDTVDTSSNTPPPLSTSVASTTANYDSFGRVVQSFGLDGHANGKTVYHAVSTDGFDAID